MTDQINAPAGVQLSHAAIIQEMGAQVEHLTRRGYLLATAVDTYKTALESSKARVVELEAELAAMQEAAVAASDEGEAE
jgi:hypothetical protein